MAFHTSPYPSSQPTIQYGRGASARSTKFSVHTDSWGSFARLFLPENLFLPRFEIPAVNKLSSPWILPWALLEGAPQYRKAEHVSHPTLLVIDVDNKTLPYVTFEQAQQALHRAIQDPQSPLYRQAAALYTTWSHSPDHPHFRIFLPLSPDHLIHKGEQKKLRDLGHAVASILSIPHHAIDPSSFDVARLFFLPACPPEAADLYQYAIFPSDPQTATFLDPDTILASVPAPASTPTKSKTDNVLPINPTIQLPVYQSSSTTPSNPLSPLPANMDPKQYKKLMAVSAKCLKEQGEPQWTLQTLEDMQDAAPYMGLEDRTNYAILLNCFATYEEEIDSLASDTEGPLPGRAFDLFTSMARQAKGYESAPEQEYRAHWEDVKAGGNEYGFKGFEAIHPGVLFRKALDNGWSRVLVKVTDPVGLDDLTWDYSKKWPFPFRFTLSGEINPINVADWMVKECKDLIYLEEKGGELAGEWRYAPKFGIFLHTRITPFASHICTTLYKVLETKGEKEKDIRVLSNQAFHASVAKQVFETPDVFNGEATPLFIRSPSSFDLVEFGHILPVQNGFLDLREGKLLSLSHTEKMKLKFTKVMAVPYYEEAPEPVEFLKFLDTVCKGRKDMIEDLRDFLAGSLWGTPSNTAGVFVGNGNNGKSVLVNTIMKMFGFEVGGPDLNQSFATIQDYTFIAKKPRNNDNGSAPKPELSELHGRRLLRIQETSEDMVMDGAKIKMLHAEGAGFLFRELFSNDNKVQDNTATIIIETNHAPIVSGGLAMDRRIVFFPFEHVFPLKDGEKQKLDFAKAYFEKEGPAILKWLVNAKNPNKNSGWGETVSEYTEFVLGDSNPFRLFVKDCIEKTDNASDILTTAELISMYRDWALKNKIVSLERVGLLDSRLMKNVSPFMPRRPTRLQGSSGPVSVFEYVKPAKGVVIEGACTEAQTVKLRLSMPTFVASFLDEYVRITRNQSDYFTVSEALSILQRSADAEMRDSLNPTMFGLLLGEWVKKNKLIKKESTVNGSKKARVFGAVLVEEA